MTDQKLFYSTEQTCAATGLCRTSIWRLEQRGDFPRRRQISKNRVGWLVREIKEWAESRPEADTSAEE
jgi:prophage regulatory protein